MRGLFYIFGVIDDNNIKGWVFFFLLVMDEIMFDMIEIIDGNFDFSFSDSFCGFRVGRLELIMIF